VSSSGQSLEEVARHEAGHVAALEQVRVGVAKITLTFTVRYAGTAWEEAVHGGRTYYRQEPADLEDQIVALLAGVTAEGLLWSDVPAGHQDIAQAIVRAEKKAAKEEGMTVNSVLDRCQSRALQIIKDSTRLRARVEARLIRERTEHPEGKLEVRDFDESPNGEASL
jgi:ATP-dependent Zn protease